MNQKRLSKQERLGILRKWIEWQSFGSFWIRPTLSNSLKTYQRECGGIEDITVRRDLDAMVEEGLLERRLGGRGWFIYYEYRIKDKDNG